MNSLDQIRIVMINTSDSGNLGSAARAMKTMGFKNLCLVAPLDPPTTSKAVARASGAADVLHHARIVDTLDEAIADCTLVVGASARMRTIPWPLITPPVLAGLVDKEPSDSKVAILFGREDNGLSNDELRRCHYHVTIPGDEDYCVLNVAQAIQVICYQLRQTLVELPAAGPIQDAAAAFGQREWDSPAATDEEMERFFQHFEQTLVELDFMDPHNPRQLPTRLRRLFNRVRLDRMEVNVLRGILTAMQKRMRQSG